MGQIEENWLTARFQQVRIQCKMRMKYLRVDDGVVAAVVARGVEAVAAGRAVVTRGEGTCITKQVTQCHMKVCNKKKA